VLPVIEKDQDLRASIKHYVFLFSFGASPLMDLPGVRWKIGVAFHQDVWRKGNVVFLPCFFPSFSSLGRDYPTGGCEKIVVVCHVER
jgi:hypothetical protein